MLDGRVSVINQEGFVHLAPNGRYIADGAGSICGTLISGHELHLRDLDSGALLASVSDRTKAFTPYAWSPDSQELLYQERDWSGSLACPSEVRWFVLTRQGPTAVSDLDSLFARWYGLQLVELVCQRPVYPGLTAATPDS